MGDETIDREPDLSAAASCSPKAQNLLMSAATRSVEIRRATARIREAARERRALILQAYELERDPGHRKVTYDIAALASGVAPKVIGGQISLAREEAVRPSNGSGPG